MTEYARHYPDEILSAGAAAPGFTLHATPDQSLNLDERAGSRVVLVFYPADWSGVCSDELSVFNAALPLFRKKHATVLGISVDSAWSHQAFIAARGFHFDLLSDFEPKSEVSKRYGAYDYAGGVSKRALFLIDESQTIVWSYLSPVALNPGVDGVLDALDALDAPAS